MCKPCYNRAFFAGRGVLDAVALPPMSQAERSARRALVTRTATGTGPPTATAPIDREAAASVALAPSEEIRICGLLGLDIHHDYDLPAGVEKVVQARRDIGDILAATESDLAALRRSLLHAIGEPDTTALTDAEWAAAVLTDEEIAAEVRLVVRARNLERLAMDALRADVTEVCGPSPHPWTTTEIASEIRNLARAKAHQAGEVERLISADRQRRCALHDALGFDADDEPEGWDALLDEVRRVVAGVDETPAELLGRAAEALETQARRARALQEEVGRG